MKKILFLAIVAYGCALNSCTDQNGELVSFAQNREIASLNSMRSTRAVDSTSVDSILPIEETEESARLHETLRQHSIQSVSALASYGEEDEYFSSNIYAIREMPLNISVRSVATGSNASNKYLSCSEAGKEVVLSRQNTAQSSKFFLKILPATSGIPYLIYSKNSNTPLNVGYYTNKPDDKILMSAKDNSGSLYSASWDLLASPSYKGYFAIQSESYIGQADPNNSWSIFYYVLEAKANNKLGYARRVNGKGQQEFFIQPIDKFDIDYIEFDKSSAQISKLTPLEVVSYGKNETEERRSFSIKASHYATDTYQFSETGRLKFLWNDSLTFYRPYVLANKLVVPSPVNPDEEPNPGEFLRDMKYSNSKGRVRRVLTVETEGIAKPNSLIEVTSYLEGNSVSANYVAEMKVKVNNEERKVKVKGTWYGTMYTTKRAKPDIVKCFDLDDGEELSLRKKSHPVIISKTILK